MPSSLEPSPQSQKVLSQLRHQQRLTGIKRLINLVSLLLVTAIVGLLALFLSGRLTYGGVPASIILTFLTDDPARTAYIQGDRRSLHDRLQVLGVEEQIKDYYRPQIADEAELDRYIHQIFYDRTGYVGDAYQVNAAGKLVLK